MTHIVRILQASDFHLCADPNTPTYGMNTDKSLSSILYTLTQHALPDSLLIATGDLSQDGSAASYERAHTFLQHTRLDFCCLPGNHDNPSLMQAALLSCPKRLRRAGWSVILLDTTVADSQGGNIRETDLIQIGNWLHEDAESPCLIFMHHALIAMESPWLDTMRIDNADYVLDCLAPFDQIKAVVFGHVHQELDIRHRGIRFLACPSTCAQFKPRSVSFELDPIAPGFRWIDLYPDGHLETGILRVPY
jgi:Icc protein